MTPELPPLGEVIRRHRLSARKGLGQHFLLDLNLTARIARAAAPLDACEVIEIGPGPGGLTRALLLAGARHVTAIERDPRAVAALAELAAAFPDRLTIIEGDALEIDTAAIAPASARKIVANLPYNVATPLLLGWLANIDAYDSLTLMFQKEVALRLAAKPGGKDYGRLSVMTQWCAEPRLLFDIGPKAFVPPPKVTSTLVQLTPRQARPPCRREDLERVAAAAFGQRRKMLRASLKSLAVDTVLLMEKADIAPTDRAENLTIEQFAALARAYAEINSRRAGG